MSTIAVDVFYDRDQDGLRYSRSGMVADAAMTVQVATYGESTLFHFYSVEGFSSRRLINAAGDLWIDIAGRAIKHTGKYLPLISKIKAARAN